MAEQWFSIVEYARAFNVSDMTVRRRIKTGKLHAVLKEGKYFIPVPVSNQRSESLEKAAASFPHSQVMTPAEANMGYGHAGTPKYKPSQNEMVVVKGHPSAHKTFPQACVETNATGSSRAREIIHRRSSDLESLGEQAIPSSLSQPFSGRETTLVDSRALLAFCEATMKKLSELERRQVERFKSKLEALEATIENRNLEIKQLKQQLEDMQLLVKILEKKK